MFCFSFKTASQIIVNPLIHSYYLITYLNPMNPMEVWSHSSVPHLNNLGFRAHFLHFLLLSIFEFMWVYVHKKSSLHSFYSYSLAVLPLVNDKWPWRVWHHKYNEFKSIFFSLVSIYWLHRMQEWIFVHMIWSFNNIYMPNIFKRSKSSVSWHKDFSYLMLRAWSQML